MTKYKKPQKVKKGQKTGDVSSEATPMPLERAFVVQFRQAAESEPDWFSGRVEHVMSGEYASFANHRELNAFFRRVLNQQFSPSREKEGGRKLRT